MVLSEFWQIQNFHRDVYSLLVEIFHWCSKDSDYISKTWLSTIKINNSIEKIHIVIVTVSQKS
jgi:hypothetical protein